MADDLSDRISEAVAGPVSASSDGQSATEQPVDALIKADQYTNTKAALGTQLSGWKCVRRTQAKPPGSV